jgi:hypothetical protein
MSRPRTKQYRKAQQPKKPMNPMHFCKCRGNEVAQLIKFPYISRLKLSVEYANEENNYFDILDNHGQNGFGSDQER